MATIEKLCAPGVYDPPGYSQLIKVSGARSHPDHMIELEAIAVI